MDTGVGATLREARNRRKIDLVEVEAAIKIRIRFLQAIENEEWDTLPGGAYTRGFIRTYAAYLGLDGERLADDYRRATAPPGGERVPRRVEPVPSGTGADHSRFAGRVLAAAVTLGLVALLVGIGLAGGDGDSNPDPAVRTADKQPKQDSRPEPAVQRGVEMRLAATAEVWVCLLDAEEEPLVDGQILTEGTETGTFRSDGFEVALGNGSVSMFVNGERADVPASASPVGYRVGASGKLTALEEGERPDCE